MVKSGSVFRYTYGGDLTEATNLMFQSLDLNCCRKARGPPLPGGPPDIGGRGQPRLTEAHQQGRHLQLLNL